MSSTQREVRDRKPNRNKGVNSIECWVMTLNNEGCTKYLIVLLREGEVVRADSVHNEASAVGQNN